MPSGRTGSGSTLVLVSTLPWRTPDRPVSCTLYRVSFDLGFTALDGDDWLSYAVGVQHVHGSNSLERWWGHIQIYQMEQTAFQKSNLSKSTIPFSAPAFGTREEQIQMHPLNFANGVKTRFDTIQDEYQRECRSVCRSSIALALGDVRRR